MVAWDFVILPDNAALDRDVLEDVEGADVEGAENGGEETITSIMYKDRQTYLKDASEKMQSGYHVQLAIKPEPENDHDRNAIAILLEYGCDQKTVGYIAKELTGY